MMTCEGRMPNNCDMQAIHFVDIDATWGDIPTWVQVVPMCDSCTSSAHRGGYVHSTPIKEWISA